MKWSNFVDGGKETAFCLIVREKQRERERENLGNLSMWSSFLVCQTNLGAGGMALRELHYQDVQLMNESGRQVIILTTKIITSSINRLRNYEIIPYKKPLEGNMLMYICIYIYGYKHLISSPPPYPKLGFILSPLYPKLRCGLQSSPLTTW